VQQRVALHRSILHPVELIVDGALDLFESSHEHLIHHLLL